MSDAKTNTGRTGWVKAVPYATIAAYVVGPFLLIPIVGSPWHIVAFIFAVAAFAGLIDGFAFRPTLSLPLLAGVGFLIAKTLYFNDGTFIYALGAVATCAAATGIVRLVRESPSQSDAEA
ncbi:hypothetical protein Q0N48_07290 [Corynebacterium ureicelerivorans]|uniref:hypothetical protein n=1 Tax=Corynebacterium ureicelerivorans TaxID=401472 RepID=UPI0026550168|nr:hypothetical protein [Corynebacterium ureicelerivorans]MDN8605794.1 hypothetical protein [Corynebacterium ureicelerivorans]